MGGGAAQQVGVKGEEELQLALRVAAPAVPPLPVAHDAPEVGEAQRARLAPKLRHHGAGAGGEGVQAVLQQVRHGAREELAHRLGQRLALQPGGVG